MYRSAIIVVLLVAVVAVAEDAAIIPAVQTAQAKRDNAIRVAQAERDAAIAKAEAAFKRAQAEAVGVYRADLKDAQERASQAKNFKAVAALQAAIDEAAKSVEVVHPNEAGPKAAQPPSQSDAERLYRAMEGSTWVASDRVWEFQKDHLGIRTIGGHEKANFTWAALDDSTVVVQTTAAVVLIKVDGKQMTYYQPDISPKPHGKAVRR